MTKYIDKFHKLLNFAIKSQASDLHISVGHSPIIRVSGSLTPLVKEDKINSEESKGLAFSLLNEEQQEKFLKEKEIDFSYNFEDKARFRINVFYQKGDVAIALRLIPMEIKTIEELNLPSVLHSFTEVKQGFVLICGPSSQGKSTTLAALINEINNKRNDHVVTIEDPIEYVFKDNQSIIHQREVGKDTLSFASALRSSFRQDPDVIMVGEMRDVDTMETAITAAETGHLVFTTLHTNSASQTIHRIVDSFDARAQDQIRSQLSTSLLGIVSQRLIPNVRGGLIPATEILIANHAVSNLIRENKVHEIPAVIETSLDQGMMSLNRSLNNLVRRKEITLENALRFSLRPGELKKMIK